MSKSEKIKELTAQIQQKEQSNLLQINETDRIRLENARFYGKIVSKIIQITTKIEKLKRDPDFVKEGEIDIPGMAIEIELEKLTTELEVYKQIKSHAMLLSR